MNPAEISQVTGCPPANVAANWPLIVSALTNRGIGTTNTLVAAAATIAIEAPPFAPINEWGGPKQWQKYQGKVGNNEPGDGIKYHGRGFIQLTGRTNYRRYGELLGIDLLTNPDKALESDTAAEIFALYFDLEGVSKAAEAQRWRATRTLVNGPKANGWSRYIGLVDKLLKLQ